MTMQPKLFIQLVFTDNVDLASGRPQAQMRVHGHSQKRATESITFRLESRVLNKLRQEALRKDISINTLVSQTLKQHADWHSNAARAGFVVTRRSFLNKIMEMVSDDNITSISKFISTKEMKDFVLLLRNEYDIGSALSVMDGWSRASGYAFRHENTDNLHSHVIQHEMGRKMSLFLAELYRNLFEDFGLKTVHFDLTDKTLSFIVEIADSS
jgi:hypothetical protein